MNGKQFLDLRKSLKPGQALMLIHNGNELVAKLLWRDDNDKKHYKFLGKLEDFPEMIVPTINKPWATPPIPGKQSFYKFGQILPKYNRQNEVISRKIQKWTMAFNALKALEFSPKKSIWEDTYLRIRYNVEELGGVKIYYYHDTPRYVEFDGEKLAIIQLKPELKIEKFDNLEDVK